jgi:indole-3-glycerol phosphate synthase
MNNILIKIIDQKKIEVAGLNAAELQRAAGQSPMPRDFISAIKPGQSGMPIRLIAELKRASPSKGILAPQLDMFQVAEIYHNNGAAAISVLTDEKFFLGKLETLRELRFTHSTPLPLLRKDFIIDESQLYESRVIGADAVLLIAAVLTDNIHLASLHACALHLGLAALVEVHNEAEIERALSLDGLKLVGINNRDLASFEISLNTTERLRPLIPAGITVVAESGIFHAEDVNRVANANVDAVLVGEALVTAPDIAAKVRELAGVMVSR